MVEVKTATWPAPQVSYSVNSIVPVGAYPPDRVAVSVAVPPTVTGVCATVVMVGMIAALFVKLALL